MACKTPEQIAAENAAAAAAVEREKALLAEQAKIAAELAAIAEEKRKRAEADTTNLTMVPILTSSDVKVECVGLFFNEHQIASDAVPAKELTIEKDVLDRSSAFFVGRFKAEIKDRSKIVFEVSMNGHKIDGYGTNLPYIFTSGQYDTTVLDWPEEAWANYIKEPTKFTVHVKTGLVTGIVESQLGLIVWDTVKAITEADFVINLLPNKLPRD